MVEITHMAGHLVRRLHQISVSVFAESMKRHELDCTPVQFAALSKLSQHPGIDQATLAGLIAHDRVTMGGVVDRLVSRGLISRVTSDRDRRARVLKMTDKGHRFLEQIEPIVASCQDDILTGLAGDEREMFLALLEKTTAAGNRLSRAPLLEVRKGDSGASQGS